VEHERALREFLVESANGLGISLTDQQTRQFLVFLSHLLTWNRTINLTAITEPYEIISKHFVDSLTALKAFDFPLQGRVVDVGTGAGFPGIPLRIVRSDLRLVLIEPSQKKTSFLHSVVGALKLDHVSIFSGGLTQYAAQHPPPVVDVMVVRALRFDEMAESAALILNPGGHLLLYRTEIGHEIVPRDFRVESNHTFSLPLNYGSRVVTVLARSAAA
jgi:16S rRNA (guanine527-N7)-methyltransferase